MRFLMAGSDGLLVELADLEIALALLDRLQAAPVEGLRDLVPAARTVLLRFDPLQTSVARLRDHVTRLDLTPGPARSGDSFEIPVRYDGADLQDVADLLGWSVETLIRRHTEAVFTVAFCGFAPGFAYMTCSDPAFDVPRRASPRVRIPAGSVALAGRFGGIYPSDGPGGWQLLGSTPVAMWDLARPRPALLAPGDRVVFRDMAKGAAVPARAPAVPAPVAKGQPALTITRADHPALFQDEGRPGQAAQGVAQSGALDRAALRRLNRILGNPRGTAAVEMAFGGIALRAEAAVTLALTGAPCRIELTRATGLRKLLPADQAFALDAGDCIAIGAPDRGMVSYLGLRGGFSVAPVLGSAARDTLARIGPEPVGEGDTLYRGGQPAHPIAPEATPADLPRPGEVVPIDIVLGPRDDWFTPKGLTTLTGQDWEVTQQISRTGKRLSGAVPLERREAGELPSEPTVPGAIQVPHNGQPVLFMADHPLTGGYPVIACVADHHLDLAAQIPPGAFIRFRLISKDL